MHLYKRGNVWWIEYISNKVKYRQSTHATDRRSAAAWMSAIQTARKMPSFAEAVNVLKILYKQTSATKTTLSSVWPEYVRIAKAVGRLSLSKKTISDRQNEVERLVGWIDSKAATVKSVEDVSGQIAALYAEHLASDIKSPSGSPISAKTRRNIIGHLSAVWNILEKISPEIHNPWKGLSPRNDDGRRLDPFSDEQVEAILAASRSVGKDWLPVCTIAAHTGLRYGDIATMRWKSVDMEHGVLLVTPNKTKAHGIEVSIPFGEAVREVIADIPRNGEFLFPLHAKLYGKRGKKYQDKLNFREVLVAAGIYGQGRFTFHSFRHTCATKLASAGVGKETRKLILGHTTDENAERYDHADHLEAKRAALASANL